MRIDSCLRCRSRRLTLVMLAVAYLAVWSVAFPPMPAEAKPAGSFEIPAWTFDRGNAKVYANPDLYADYRDTYPELVAGDGGRLPWVVQYEVDFPVDAKKVVFAYKKGPKERYRIYEIGIDGKGLRQLTFEAADEAEIIRRYGRGYDDIYPCYLPGGKIMFASTRSKRWVFCAPVTVKTQEENLATLFVQDVYRGLTGIERGRVKYLRVMEAIGVSWGANWRSSRQGDSAGLQASAVSHKGDVNIKKIHGIVAVHEDGSACFTVPAEKNLFFQALDENYMELQRMRTFVNLMPGDSGPRTVHYALDVRPILDKHCVGCHGSQEPRGELDLSGGLTKLYDRSYENLSDSGLVSYLSDCYGSANVPAEPPLTFGSHRSKLVERIRQDPCRANLTREEFIKIVTWIDANAPYYGTHEGKKNLKWKGDVDFRPLPLAGK